MMNIALITTFLLALVFVASAQKDTSDISLDGQTKATLVHNGVTRTYVKYVPQSGIVKGLAIVLIPIDSTYVDWTCAAMVGKVTAETDYIVVCPAALPGTGTSDKRLISAATSGAKEANGKDDKSDTSDTGKGDDDKKDAGPAPCWRAFANYGQCDGGKPESSDDVTFIAALIDSLEKEHSVPTNRTIVSGFSNGGSMAFRVACEASTSIDALVIAGQAWFDPIIGYYDNVNKRIPTSTLPGCQPQKKVHFLSEVGTSDVYYGTSPAAPGFEAVANWRTYSTQILGCEGSPQTLETEVVPGGVAKNTCYQYRNCGGVDNVMCSLAGVGHDGARLVPLLKTAVSRIFGDEIKGSTGAASSLYSLPALILSMCVSMLIALLC